MSEFQCHWIMTCLASVFFSSRVFVLPGLSIKRKSSVRPPTDHDTNINYLPCIPQLYIHIHKSSFSFVLSLSFSLSLTHTHFLSISFLGSPSRTHTLRHTPTHTHLWQQQLFSVYFLMFVCSSSSSSPSEGSFDNPANTSLSYPPRVCFLWQTAKRRRQ